MTIKYTNNAKTTITSAITDTDTSITVADVSTLPALGVGDTAYLTLSNEANSVTEIVLCTNITGNVLTVQRAYDNTTAKVWGAGTIVSSRLTAGMLDTLLEEKQDTLVSGTSIKTLNGQSVLGSGDVDLDARYYTETEVDTALTKKVDNNDSRLSDSREWTADTVTQVEAEAGTATTRRAWTAQRVRQAINSVVNAIGNATQSVAGWMSAADKTKLDGIEAGATSDQTKADIDALGINAGTLNGAQLSDIVQKAEFGVGGSGPVWPNAELSDETGVGTGFYRYGGAADRPSPAYGQLIYFKDASGATQIAIAGAYSNGATAGGLFIRHRTTDGNGFSPWAKIWNEQNDGIWSGLDADTLRTLVPTSTVNTGELGQLVKVGDFGVGKHTSNVNDLFASNFNTFVNFSGSGTTSGSWGNGPQGNGVTHTGMLTQVYRSYGNLVYQVYVGFGGDVYHRSGRPDLATWNEWNRVCDSNYLSQTDVTVNGNWTFDSSTTFIPVMNTFFIESDTATREVFSYRQDGAVKWQLHQNSDGSLGYTTPQQAHPFVIGASGAWNTGTLKVTGHRNAGTVYSQLQFENRNTGNFQTIQAREEGIEFDTAGGIKVTNGVNGHVEIENKNSSYTHYQSSTGQHYFYGKIRVESSVQATSFIGDGSQLTGTSSMRATGTTKADVGLDRVSNIRLKWAWGAGTPTHIWGSEGDQTESKVYGPAAMRNMIGRATSTQDGLVRVRLNGTTAYITTNGSNA